MFGQKVAIAIAVGPAVCEGSSHAGLIGIQGLRLMELKKPNGDAIKAQRDVGYT